MTMTMTLKTILAITMKIIPTMISMIITTRTTTTTTRTIRRPSGRVLEYVIL